MIKLWNWLTDLSCFGNEQNNNLLLELEKTLKLSLLIIIAILGIMFFIKFISFAKEF